MVLHSTSLCSATSLPPPDGLHSTGICDQGILSLTLDGGRQPFPQQVGGVKVVSDELPTTHTHTPAIWLPDVTQSYQTSYLV